MSVCIYIYRYVIMTLVVKFSFQISITCFLYAFTGKVSND